MELILRIIILFLFCFLISQTKAEIDKNNIYTLSNFKCKFQIKYTNKNTSKELIALLNEVLSSVKNTKSFSNMYALKNKVKDIVGDIKKKSIDFGYFDTSIRYEISPVCAKNVVVNIFTDTGVRYKISNIDLLSSDTYKLLNQNAKINEYFDSANYTMKGIIDLCNRLEAEFRNNGYPYAQVTENEVHIDKIKKNVRIIIKAKYGDKFYFGETRLLTSNNINRNFIKNRIFWNRNGLYKEDQIQMTSHMLMISQIFSDVDIILDKKNATKIDGENSYIVPIDLKLQEEKPRAIEFNLTYSTSKRNGFYKHYKEKGKLKSLTGKFKWSHYNIFSTSCKLSLGMSGTPHNIFKKNEANDYEMSSDLEVPDTFIPCDNTIYSAKNIQVYKNAYYKKSQLFSATWTSPPTIQDFKFHAGIIVDDNNITSPITKQNKPIEIIDKYNSICFPLSFSIDKRDSAINPTKNGEISTTIIPMIFPSKLANNATLVKISGSINFDISKRKKTIISLKCIGAQILGKNLNEVPVDKKLYAGGISSVRGYADQMASNLHDKTRYPIGGGALLEFSCEMRQNIKNDFGTVLFLDTAKVSRNNIMNKDNWHTGVGVGLRYNTIVGPIRFDIAMPLKKRRSVDRRYQIYISLGQAF